MAGIDDELGNIDSASNFSRSDPIDGSLGKTSAASEGGLRLVHGSQILCKRHGGKTRHKRRVLQGKNAGRLVLAKNGYPEPMGKTPSEARRDRWAAAFEAARQRVEEAVDEQPGLSQSEISRRIDALGRAKFSQRSVGRYILSETQARVDNITALFAVIPEAADAFEASLSEAETDGSEEASWRRLASRFAALMDSSAGYRLLDALEDLAGLGSLNTGFPHLRQAAHDIRAHASNDEKVRAVRKKKTGPDI